MKIISKGVREVNSDFWALTGVLEKDTERKQRPFILIVENTNLEEISFEVINNTEYLYNRVIKKADYENMKIFYQWEGKWRSDWFEIEVEDFTSKYQIKYQI